MSVKIPKLEAIGNNEEVWLSDDRFVVWSDDGALTESEAAEVIRRATDYEALEARVKVLTTLADAAEWWAADPRTYAGDTNFEEVIKKYVKSKALAHKENGA